MAAVLAKLAGPRGGRYDPMHIAAADAGDSHAVAQLVDHQGLQPGWHGALTG